MNSLSRKILLGTIAVSLFTAIPVLAQKPLPPKPEIPGPVSHAGKLPQVPNTSERSIAVDKNVIITLCVSQGNLKVNGWNRSEVRVFIKDGAKFSLPVQQKSTHGDSPGWIKIVAEPIKGRLGVQPECIWGDDIEIDAPSNSAINMTGNETTTTIDGVRKVEIRTLGGDISLRNITSGIKAEAGQGDISVDESEGSIGLVTTTGNIVVFDTGPSEIGDVFKARTNSGTVSMQSLQHRQIDVSSISGSVLYDGDILEGGSYSLNTVKGSIKMSIPQNSSCQIVAFFGYGNFNSELPLKIETEDKYEGPTRRVIGKLGTGGATVRLTSNNGSIFIKKR